MKKVSHWTMRVWKNLGDGAEYLGRILTMGQYR